MRKVISCLLIAMCFSFFLASCAAYVSRVVPVALSKQERQDAAAANEKTLHFNVQADKKFKWVTLTLEEYRLGVKDDKPLGHIACQCDGKGRFAVTFATVVPDQPDIHDNCVLDITYEKVLLSGNSTTDTAPVLCALEDTRDIGYRPCVFFSVAKAADLPESGRMALACLCYAKGGKGSGLAESSFGDPAGALDEIRQYDLAYVVSCAFSEDEPAE